MFSFYFRFNFRLCFILFFNFKNEFFHVAHECQMNFITRFFSCMFKQESGTLCQSTKGNRIWLKKSHVQLLLPAFCFNLKMNFQRGPWVPKLCQQILSNMFKVWSCMACMNAFGNIAPAKGTLLIPQMILKSSCGKNVFAWNYEWSIFLRLLRTQNMKFKSSVNISPEVFNEKGVAFCDFINFP